MRRMLVLAAVAAAVLATAPAAVAKELTKAAVCGPEDCVAVEDESGRTALMSGGGSPMDPPRGAPYYEVRGRIDHGEEHAKITFAVVPSRKAVHYDDGSWYAMPAEMSALVSKITADSKPFPATGLVGWAAPPDPQRQPATPAGDDGNPLWPEGAIIALLALAAAAATVRFSSRFRPAGSA